MGWFHCLLQSSGVGAHVPTTLWWLTEPLAGGLFASRLFLVPLSAGPCSIGSQFPSASQGGAAWTSEVPVCLTRVGVPHHGGQAPPLAHVHGHKDCILADDVAGLAGVHSVHLVTAAGPCGWGSWGSVCGPRKSYLTQPFWKLKERARPVVPVFGIP